MTRKLQKSQAGFTLVELLVGMTLALVVLSAVLSTFTFLGRNLIRLSNQQTLEAEARRTLAYFTQDTRMASSLGSASSTTVTFTQLTSTNTTTVAYNYYTNPTTVSGVSIAAGSLTRTAPSGGTPVILLRNLRNFGFQFYDSSSNAVTDLTDKISSIKKVAMTFNTQTGRSTDGTLTPVYQAASPQLTLRNKPLLD